MSKSKSTLMITALFVFGIIGAYSVYKAFLLSMFVAMLLTMATFNLTKKLTDYTNSSHISAAISTMLLMLLLFAPIIYLTKYGVVYISEVDSAGIQETIHTLQKYISEIPYIKDMNSQYLTDDKIVSYINESTKYITVVGKLGFGFMKDIFFVVIFYFFINYYGENFFDILLDLLPISSSKGENMIEEVSATMEIVFYSVVITAVFEGFLFGIVMGAFGFNGLFFGVIYGFASLIPIVGGFIVWAPVSFYAWTKIDAQTAIIIAIYSVVMISIIADTFIKPMIIQVIKDDFVKSPIKINSMVIFFSILAGMSSYGFWGMIVGPAITSFLIATTKVYLDHNEMG